ncbi:protein tiptop [Elysia marginata]|uniref:Protein tiptop n=1 Tax=Elysia marginata TaxID=1093978 RepID=A0AAV4EGY9_9GAST|nr:protein tiptop [Elysia marginata]
MSTLRVLVSTSSVVYVCGFRTPVPRFQLTRQPMITPPTPDTYRFSVICPDISVYRCCENQSGSEGTQEQTVESQAVDSKSGSEEEGEEEEEEEEIAEKAKTNRSDQENEEPCKTDDSGGDPQELSEGERCSVSFNAVSGNKKDSSLILEDKTSKKTDDETGLNVDILPQSKQIGDENPRVTRDISERACESQIRVSEEELPENRSSIIPEEARLDGSKRSRYKSSLSSSADARCSPPRSPHPPRSDADKHSVTSTRKSRSSTSASNAGTPSEVTNSKYKYSSKLSPPAAYQSPGLELPDFDRHMALVMSSMPLALLAKGRKDVIDARPGYFSSILDTSCSTLDDQPLDLSKKTDREKRRSENDVDGEQYTFRADPLQSKHSSSLSSLSPLPSSILANGFSSLQSLQQRFGGDFPIGTSHSSGSSVIPLQPSLTPKPSPSGGSLASDHAALRTSGAHRYRHCGNTRGADWLDKQEKAALCSSSSSPPAKQERKSRHHTASPLISPVEDNEPSEGSSSTAEGGRSKHTIHRCSCHKTFGSLYGLSVHLQETGHAPGASRSTSLMDYPKLVRGQDMWLNQESEQTRRILRCMQCGESFKSLPLLTVHMMQTQHYTKIVSSEHGRRSHKCSTYCDRELDKECIFKCKVCHETFTDMEGLANHMIVSGHHKKQSSSRHVTVTSSQNSLSDVSALARHGGRRKRFLRDDAASAAAAAVEMAAVSSSAVSFLDSASAILDYSGRQSKTAGFGVSGLGDEALANGFHIDSFGSAISPRKALSSSPQGDKMMKTILCDSCGKRFDAPIFDAHVRACLRQRAEVIDALKSKLAVEEALLSRSESKLLRSGFTLSSSSSSTAAGGELQEERPSVKSEVDSVNESETFLEQGPGGVCEVEDRIRTAVSKSESGASVSAEENHISPTNQLPPKSSPESDSPDLKAKICDLLEVPLKKWHCSRRDENSSTVLDSREVPPSSSKESHIPADPAWKLRKEMANEAIENATHRAASLSDMTASPHPGQKRKIGDVGSPGSSNSNDSIPAKSRAPIDSDRLNFKEDTTISRSHSTADSASDFTSSALHKLDMFSRGLNLSPPRRATLSPEGTKQPLHHSNSGGKSARRREISGSHMTSASRRESFTSKSPLAASISPMSVTKSDGSPEPLKDATFDILDPNMGCGDNTSSSAIEAMESFIHKSFSAKSDIRTSNLATMFSPFRTCFPLPGSLPGHMSADPSDPAISCFAKFSKFFRMVPGAPPLPDMASSRPNDQKCKSLPFGLSTTAVRANASLDMEKHGSNQALVLDQASSSPLISHKNPAPKPFLPKLSKGFAVKNPSKSADSVTSAKRYKYSSLNPHEVAKHMLQGIQYPSSPCIGPSGSIVASTPLAASCGTSVRNSSKDSSASSSALPSTSELEKIKSELRRKRKLSSSAELFEDMESTEDMKGDGDQCASLRPDSRENVNREDERTTWGYNKSQVKSEKASSVLTNKKSTVRSLSSSEQRHDSTKDKFESNEGTKDDEDKHCEAIEQNKSPILENDQEGSQLNAVARDDKADVTKHKSSALDINDIVNTGDNKNGMNGSSLFGETHDSGENKNRNEKSKQRTLDDGFKLCSSFKQIKKNCISNTECPQIRSPSHSLTDCNENESILDESSCNDVEQSSSQVNRQSYSSVIKSNKMSETSRAITPSPLPNKSEDCSEDGTKNTPSSQMVNTKLAHCPTLEKASRKRNRSEVDLQGSIKLLHSPSSSSSKDPDQSLDDLSKDNAPADNIEEKETNKDDLRSGRSSASSSLTFSPTSNKEHKSKKHSDVDENSSTTTTTNKSSALDSLSCFVYSQPLTSEHPLDSLQKLLSTNDLPSGQQGHSKCFNSSSFATKSFSAFQQHVHPVNRTPPASTSCRTPDPSPLNLTTNTESSSSHVECETKAPSRHRSNRDRGKDLTSDSDDNEEGLTNSGTPAEDADEAAESGGASDGEGNVYKCAACNRQFASKGSYRYHLSRCHLSSVKKLGIKDAFNMSPYVYLPLDHTAKFSKYYQMAHELANKGK